MCECFNCFNSFICKKKEKAKETMNEDDYLEFISEPCSDFESDDANYGV